jgi:hypothetical protein
MAVLTCDIKRAAHRMRDQFNPSASLEFTGFSVSDYARNHYDSMATNLDVFESL